MPKEKVVECLSSFPFIAWEFLGLSIINSRHSSCQLSVSMLSLSVSMLSAVRFYAVSAFQAHSKVLKIEFPHSWLSIKPCVIQENWWGSWGENSRKLECEDKVDWGVPIYELKVLSLSHANSMV